jgi:hypothetical protein
MYQNFNVKHVYPNGNKRYQTFCKECNKLYAKEWYTTNSSRIIARNRINRSGYVDWFNEYKKTLSCTCGENHPACLEFHHIDPSIKEFEISGAVRLYGKEKIMNEIAKCIVLCSNCHRKRHWDENNKKVLTNH